MIVGVLGHFAEGKNLLNGQTVKTKIVTAELIRRLGEDQVLKIDTHGGVKTLFKAPFQVLRVLKKSKNAVIFPAHNGLRIYVPLLFFLRPFFKGRKLHYAVIGGWLADFLKNKKVLKKMLQSFDAIYVETQTMKKALESMGFQNILVMPNCKELNVLHAEDLIYPQTEPYKLCTFSRVMKEKGIEDAVFAVKKINEQLGRTVYTLDIYGQVDAEQTEWFEQVQQAFPDYVRYGGTVPFEKSVEVLREYFALLFPTRFYTEGIPGTVIDAYAAGIPVVSAKWESFSDIVDDGKTGVGYEFENADALTDALMKILENKEAFLAMKRECLEKSKLFVPDKAIEVMMQELSF